MGLTQHPLDSIAPKYDATPASGQESTPDNDIETQPVETSEPPIMTPPALSLNSVTGPALLIDRRLRVVWQNSAAVDQIWHGAKDTLSGSGIAALFDLVFSESFQSTVRNWQRWAAFFIRQVRRMLSHDNIQQLIARMPDRQADVISTLLAQQTASHAKAASSSRLRQELSGGRTMAYDVMATEFSEGLLVIFEARSVKDDTDPERHTVEIEKRISSVRRHPNPVRQKFSVLAASLNNAAALHLEMLAEEFSFLVSQICQRSIETIEEYGGVFSKHLDSGFFAYFLPLDASEDNALRTIECCLELKTRVAELSREWKVRKSWGHDVELNIGIHKAHEHIGTLSSFAGEMVSSSGNALRVATNLSRFSQGGQIWATKALFKSMHPDIYKQLRFGVMKANGQSHHVFVRRCFKAISDLPGYRKDITDAVKGLESTAVTQIFDRQL